MAVDENGLQGDPKASIGFSGCLLIRTWRRLPRLLLTLYHRSSTGPFARNLKQTGMQDDLSQQINRVRELGKGSFNDEHNHELTLQRNSAISSIMSHHPRRTPRRKPLYAYATRGPKSRFLGTRCFMNNGSESQMFLCPSQQRWPRVVVRHRSDSLEIEVIGTSGRVVLQFSSSRRFPCAPYLRPQPSLYKPVPLVATLLW